jgi:hypothetical protein
MVHNKVLAFEGRIKLPGEVEESVEKAVILLPFAFNAS